MKSVIDLINIFIYNNNDNKNIYVMHILCMLTKTHVWKDSDHTIISKKKNGIRTFNIYHLFTDTCPSTNTNFMQL